MRIAGYMDCDAVNGIGFACSLFFQGCTHHCEGCFNSSTWNPDGGELFTDDMQAEFISACSKEYIKTISILGGEPLQQPFSELLEFLGKLKELKKPIFLWTGYKFEYVQKEKGAILDLVDTIIDGQFDINKKDKYKLRGSYNQRVWQKDDKGVWQDKTVEFT